MPKFRNKPVEIEARRFDGSWESAGPIIEWMGHTWPNGMSHPRWCCKEGGRMFIPTLKGEDEASPGDWIIRGVAGEFYSCKPDIFAETYEPA